jgi:hypothetical protein
MLFQARAYSSRPFSCPSNQPETINSVLRLESEKERRLIGRHCYANMLANQCYKNVTLLIGGFARKGGLYRAWEARRVLLADILRSHCKRGGR